MREKSSRRHTTTTFVSKRLKRPPPFHKTRFVCALFFKTRKSPPPPPPTVSRRPRKRYDDDSVVRVSSNKSARVHQKSVCVKILCFFEVFFFPFPPFFSNKKKKEKKRACNLGYLPKKRSLSMKNEANDMSREEKRGRGRRLTSEQKRGFVAVWANDETLYCERRRGGSPLRFKTENIFFGVVFLE